MHRESVGRIATALLAVVLAASCSPATPTPTPSAGGPTSTATASGTAGSASATPGQSTESPAAGPTATPTAGQPSARGLIDAALAAGTIDEPTSVLYRLYALIGDDRLPAAYRGAPAEDNDAVDQAMEELSSYPAEISAQMQPMLVRPTDPNSYWAPAAGARTTAVPLAMAAPLAQVTPACSGGWMRQDSTDPDVPVVVWGMCGRGANDGQVAAKMAEVMADMASLWPAMTGADPTGTAFMGPPIPDDQSPPNPAVPEAADGLYDIYVVDANVTVTRGGREIEAGQALAVNYWASPFQGTLGAQSTASYIVASSAYSGPTLKSNLAHEFFHGLQARYNRTGTRYRVGLTGQERAKFWFVEASAMWAEHHFVPEARGEEDGPYLRYTGRFITTGTSLAKTDGLNDYASWAWPLFMEQQNGMTAISDAWKKMVGKTGYLSLQAAVNDAEPFTDNFREFGVRVLNKDLEPGDPLNPRFKEFASDFPPDAPSGDRASLNNRLSTSGISTFNNIMPWLWSQYTQLLMPPDAHQVTFDFSLFNGSPVDVDLLLKVNGVWQRKKSDMTEQEKVCNVDEAWVVLSNHEQEENTIESVAWTANATADTCQAEAWRLVLEGPKAGAGSYSGVEESYCSYNSALGWNAIVYVSPVGPGDIRHIAVGEDNFLINTRFAFDDPVDWGSAGGSNVQITLTGDQTTTPPRVAGDADWIVEHTGGVPPDHFHVHVEVNCTTMDVQP